MKTYARVDAGVVQEIILPRTWGIDDPNEPPQFFAEDEQPIEVRFTPDFVAQMVDITNVEPRPEQGWTYVDGIFAPYVAPPPTDAEIIALNTVRLQQYTQLSTSQKNALTVRVGTLQDAIELDIATPDEIAEIPVRQAQLLDWKRYAVFLGRVTLQAGWALTVEWPEQPTDGMDLTVSAVATESPQLQ